MRAMIDMIYVPKDKTSSDLKLLYSTIEELPVLSILIGSPHLPATNNILANIIANGSAVSTYYSMFSSGEFLICAYIHP